MAYIGGYIGPYRFYRLEGRLTPPQIQFEEVSEPWEDGTIYNERGRKTPVEQLTGYIDLVNPSEPAVQMLAYANTVGFVFHVEFINNGNSIVYPNYMILRVEDVTPDDQRFLKSAIGGVNSGQYHLVSRWEVRYCLPI
jgi:hypothetical protein